MVIIFCLKRKAQSHTVFTFLQSQNEKAGTFGVWEAKIYFGGVQSTSRRSCVCAAAENLQLQCDYKKYYLQHKNSASEGVDALLQSSQVPRALHL